VSSRSYSEKPRDLPKEVLAGDVATDAVPLLSRHNSQGTTCCSRSPAAKPTPVLFANHSEKLVISIRAPFFEPSDLYSRAFLEPSDLYSRAFLWVQRSLFARLFFVRSDFYSRAILKSSRSPFARLFFVRSVFYSRAN